MKEMILFLVGLSLATVILCFAFRILASKENPSRKTIFFVNACSLALSGCGIVMLI